MGIELLKTFGISLGLTLLIEMPLAFGLGVRKRRGLFIVFLVNVLTNPAAVLVCLLIRPAAGDLYLLFQISVEIVVVITEGIVYNQFREEMSAKLKPFLLSLVLNACSYGLGLVINLFI